MARRKQYDDSEATVAEITVTDKAGQFHQFRGTIRFWHEGQICRIWNVVTGTTVASFTDPFSVVVSCPEVKS